mgnify:CR=1 FL=1
MNFKEEYQKRVNSIEEILKSYYGSYGIQPDGRRKAPSSHADAGIF